MIDMRGAWSTRRDHVHVHSTDRLLKLRKACTAKPPDNGVPSSLQVADQSQPSSDCRANAALPLCMHWDRRRQRCASCHAAHADKHSRRPSLSASRDGCARCYRVSPHASTISCRDHEQPQERRAARRRPRGGVSSKCSTMTMYACQHDGLLLTEVCMVLAGQFCVTCKCRAGTTEPGGGSSHQPVHPGQVHVLLLAHASVTAGRGALSRRRLDEVYDCRLHDQISKRSSNGIEGVAEPADLLKKTEAMRETRYIQRLRDYDRRNFRVSL